MTAALPTLLVPLRNRSQLFDVYYHQDDRDGVFVEGEVNFQVGEPLFVEINFLEEQRAFRIKGSVSWRRLSTGRHNLIAGIGVSFDEEERSTRDLILEFAHGREIVFTARESQRLPASMSISYSSDSQFLTDIVDDLSAGGVFIASDEVLEKGTELEIKLRPPGYLLGLRVKGQVAWTSTAGSRRGMGIKFIFESERKRRQLAQVVEKLRAGIIKEMRFQVPR